jgi:hypothetical protein
MKDIEASPDFADFVSFKKFPNLVNNSTAFKIFLPFQRATDSGEGDDLRLGHKFELLIKGTQE